MERLIALKNKVAKEGLDVPYAIAELKELREEFKALKKPLCVKMCRLAYEYMENYETFDADVIDDRGEDDDHTFVYFLDLLMHSDNQYNQEELREYAELLAQ